MHTPTHHRLFEQKGLIRFFVLFFLVLLSLLSAHVTYASNHFNINYEAPVCIADEDNVLVKLSWDNSLGAQTYSIVTYSRNLHNTGGGIVGRGTDNTHYDLKLRTSATFTIQVIALRGTPWHGYTKIYAEPIELVIPADFCSKKAVTLSPVTETGFNDGQNNPFNTSVVTHPDKGIAGIDPIEFKVAWDDYNTFEPKFASVFAYISNSLEFVTDSLPEHIQLNDDIVKVVGSDVHPSLSEDIRLGVDSGIFDGKTIHKNEEVRFNIHRDNILEVAFEIESIRPLLSIGAASSQVTVEALDDAMNVVGTTSSFISLDNNSDDVIETDIVVRSNAPIKAIRFYVESSDDLSHLVKNVKLTEAIELDETDGGIFSISQPFPKAEYKVYFEAKNSDNISHFPDVHNNEQPFDFRTGYSSIAFIPGIKSSRLFETENSSEEQLWEPNNNSDVEALELVFDPHTTKSTSVKQSIYTKFGAEGVIDEINSLFPTGPGVSANIYKEFIHTMDDFVASGAVAEWRTLPYDWRLGFHDVLNGGNVVGEKIYFDETHTTSEPFFFEQLQELALQSDSGKVSIVAHSMGGLLTKKLLYDLEHIENHPYHNLLKNKSFDTVFLVASPQLGTPQAIPSILHGYGEDKNIYIHEFISKHTARNLANNMESAYTLLPSEEYTTSVKDTSSDSAEPGASSLISFDKETLEHLTDEEFDAANILSFYANDSEEQLDTIQIKSHEDLIDFLEGADGRTMPDEYDFDHPTILNESLLSNTIKLHEEIDTWESPDIDGDGIADIRTVQIAGWGIPETIKGMTYFAKQQATKVQCDDMLSNVSTPSCEILESKWVLDVKPDFTFDGDKTVVIPSAVAMGTESDPSKRLETYYVDLYKYNSANVDRDHGSFFEVSEILDLIRRIVTHKNQPVSGYVNISNFGSTSNPTYLRMEIHSPVDVSIATPQSKLDKDANSFSNGYYVEFGEGKYLGVPFKTNTEHEITLSAYKSGLFTFGMHIENINGITQSQIFQNVPVSTTTIARLVIKDQIPTHLKVDHNNDGVFDKMVFTKEYAEALDFQDLITLLESLNSKQAQSFISHGENIKRLFSKGNKSTSLKQLEQLERRVRRFIDESNSGKVVIDRQKGLEVIEIISVLKYTQY